jgi:hypothetical protein
MNKLIALALGALAFVVIANESSDGGDATVTVEPTHDGETNTGAPRRRKKRKIRRVREVPPIVITEVVPAPVVEAVSEVVAIPATTEPVGSGE